MNGAGIKIEKRSKPYRNHGKRPAESFIRRFEFSLGRIYEHEFCYYNTVGHRALPTLDPIPALRPGSGLPSELLRAPSQRHERD
jgi:hypothetical protein